MNYIDVFKFKNTLNDYQPNHKCMQTYLRGLFQNRPESDEAGLLAPGHPYRCSATCLTLLVD